jgi:Holliday junction resolvase YEN1
MSNDVDALMFGSSLTIMNFSKENGSGTSSATHVTCYAMGQNGHPSNIPLDRPGMILFAMLSGGDYLPSGVPKCGSKLAAEIAKAGFGEDLLQELDSNSDVDAGLTEWRERLQYELEENESGYFSTKHKAVRVPETFPDRTILEYYARPKVSSDEEMSFLRSSLRQAWDRDIDPLAIRSFAADNFEWNYRSGARKVIKLLAEPLVSYRLRLQRPVRGVAPGFSFVPDCPPMLQRAYKARSSFGTDAMPELQLDMLPIDVVGLDLLAEEPNPPLQLEEPVPSQATPQEGEAEDETEMASEQVPQTPSKSRVTKRFDPFAIEKVWVFETVARLGVPDVVKKWEKEQAEKAEKAKKPAQKNPTRRTGPKKKGPIDPGMKRGSILKYGTLTKETTELSASKQAQFLEAVSSKNSTTNPLSRLGSGAGSTSPVVVDMGEDPFSPSMYSQQGATSMMSYSSQEVDDLLDSFSSISLSPSANIKRHPMAAQSRIRPRRGLLGTNGVEIEEPETLHAEITQSPSRPSRHRGLKLSYSISDSCDSETSIEQAPARARTALPSPSKKTRSKAKKKIEPQCEMASPVDEIEKAIENLSLSLKFDDYREDTPAEPLRQPSPVKAKEHEVGTRTTKTEAARQSSPKETAPQPKKQSCPTAADKPRDKSCHDNAVSLKKIEKDTENPKKATRKPSKDTKSDKQEHKTVGHLENVTLHHGFWSIDSSPEDSAGPTGEDSRARSGKKKKLSRVSILDLI